MICKVIGIRLEEGGADANKALLTLAFLVFLLLPVTLLLIMLGVAIVMSPLTTWDFEGAFWAALPAVSGGAAAMASPGNPPLTPFGTMILICAASAGFFILSAMLGVGGALVGPIVEGPVLGRFLGQKRTVG